MGAHGDFPVAVPCNPEALVVGRSLENAMQNSGNWKVGASLNLPIADDDFSTSSEWDGAAAQASIFEHVEFDGDKPNSALARKGFLAYDADKPGEKDAIGSRSPR